MKINMKDYNLNLFPGSLLNLLKQDVEFDQFKGSAMAAVATVKVTVL